MNKHILVIFCALINSIGCDQIEEKLPPTIVIQPNENIIIEEGRELILNCEATGVPQPIYGWQFNNKDNITWQDIGNLKIERATANKTGEYQCFAKNKHGIASSITVTVTIKQKIGRNDSEPQLVSAIEFEPLSVTCPSTDRKISWVKLVKDKDTEDETLNDIENERFSNGKDGKLYISHVLSTDSADYACTIFFEELRVIRKYRFMLQVEPQKETTKPTILKKAYISQPDEIAIAGKPYDLYCIYSGYPTPRVTWFKDDHPMVFGPQIQINYGRNTIRIKSVTNNDVGNYKCVVNGNITHTFRMDVWQLPSFTNEPRSLNATAGQHIEIICEAQGKPMPKIQWTKNGKPINVTSLNLDQINSNDTSNYGCSAINDVGKIYKDFYLNVILPEPTLKPETLTITTQTTEKSISYTTRRFDSSPVVRVMDDKTYTKTDELPSIITDSPLDFPVLPTNATEIDTLSEIISIPPNNGASFISTYSLSLLIIFKIIVLFNMQS